MKNSRNDALSVHLNAKDDVEHAIRKFTKKVRNSGIVQELLDRDHYEKPSVKRRKKHLKAVRTNSQTVASKEEENEFF